MNKKKISLLFFVIVLMIIPSTVFSNGQKEKGNNEIITLRVLAGQSTTDAGIEKFIDDALAETYPLLHDESILGEERWL